MKNIHIRDLECKILVSALGLALSGAAVGAGTDAGTIQWNGQVLQDSAPLGDSALKRTTSGATLTTQGLLTIGADAPGSMALDGPGAVWHHSGGDLFVGDFEHGGAGGLRIRSGAHVTQTLGDVVIGRKLDGASDTASVSGAGSLLQIDGGDLLIGTSDEPDVAVDNTLSITDQARVLVNATQDRLTGGQVFLSGAGGKNGPAQNSTLQILRGGVLSADNVSGSGGTIRFDGGTLELTSDQQNIPLFDGINSVSNGPGGMTLDVKNPNAQYDWNGGGFAEMVLATAHAGPLVKTGPGTLALTAPLPKSWDSKSYVLEKLTLQQGALELYSAFPNLDPSLDSTNGLGVRILELHNGTRFLDLSGDTPAGEPNQQLSLDGMLLRIVQQGNSSGGAIYQVGTNSNQTLEARNGRLSFLADGLTQDALLNVQGAMDLSGSTVDYRVALPGDRQTPPRGTTQTLIAASSNLTTTGFKTGTAQAIAGSSVAQNIALSQQGNTLVATLLDTQARPEAKALSEGALSGAITANLGADLASSQGIQAAQQAANGSAQPVGFGAVSAGQYRDNTGSHVNTDGVSVLAGLARDFPLRAGQLTTGVFAEYGEGQYATHNDFSGAPAVRGHGTARYTGGGILARFELGDATASHPYVEASARVGELKNRYNNSDLTNGADQSARYDISQRYHGAHVGVGYVWRPSARLAIDVSDRYLWTHVQGRSTTLSTGEALHFDHVNSQRNQVGVAASYQANDQLRPYVRLAWEHEFDGRMRATTNGYAIDAPSLEGDTGIATVGLRITPTPHARVSADVALQGYAGQREGVTGSLRVRYLF